MDSALVDKIVAEVMAALGRPGAAKPAPPSPAALPSAGPVGASVAARKDGDGRPKVFITAAVMADRVAGGDGAIIELAGNEFLTPAAADFVQQHHLNVRRAATSRPADAPASGPAGQPARPASAPSKSVLSGPVGLVVGQPDKKVDSLMRALAHDGIAFTECSQSDCWMENLAAMCAAVAKGELGTGVAVMRYAAEAVVLANKIDGIRACQGTRVESVAAGVRRIGANVLVLEHALSTFYELRAMARVFLTRRVVTGANRKLTEAITAVERT